jgi:hypothetical protein
MVLEFVLRGEKFQRWYPSLQRLSTLIDEK